MLFRKLRLSGIDELVSALHRLCLRLESCSKGRRQRVKFGNARAAGDVAGLSSAEHLF